MKFWKLVSYKKIRIDAVEAFKVLLLIPADVVLRAEGDSRVYVGTLGIEVGGVHRRRKLRFPRRNQTFVKDDVPIVNPCEKWMPFDFVGSSGNDGSGLWEFERPQTMELNRFNIVVRDNKYLSWSPARDCPYLTCVKFLRLTIFPCHRSKTHPIPLVLLNIS